MIALFGSISFVLTIVFLTYVGFIMVPYLRHKPERPGNPADYDWHVFVPCRDEEAVIATTIERSRERFPEAHLWVIDDDSEDATSSIISAYAARDPYVHLVQRRLPEARTGKGDALNSAYAQLIDFLPEDADHSTIIVAVVDADGELAPNAFAAVAGPDCFGDPTVGAAQITVWMKNRDDKTPYPDKGKVANAFARYLLRMQDLEFRTVILAMQSLRQKTGTVGLGGNGQFTRLSVLDEIGEGYDAPWHGALLEDYELGLHVVLAGYQNRQVHDTHVAQEALPSFKRLVVQRSRWAQGNIQCIKYAPEILRSRNFDAAGIIECFYYLLLPFLQIIGFVVVSSIVISQAIALAQNPEMWNQIIINLPFIALLGLFFGAGPFVGWGLLYKIKCEPQISWAKALQWGFGFWLFVPYAILSISRAFWRIITGKNGWSKTRRNAETNANTSIAVEA